MKLNESKTKSETTLLSLLNATRGCNLPAAGRTRPAVTAAPHRPLSPRDREYFRALRQAEMKVWLAADRPEVGEGAHEEDVKPWLARLFHLAVLLLITVALKR